MITESFHIVNACTVQEIKEMRWNRPVIWFILTPVIVLGLGKTKW